MKCYWEFVSITKLMFEKNEIILDLVSVTKLMFEKNEMLLRFGISYQINV